MHTASSANRTCKELRSASEYTATVEIPSSLHAQITRSAISPRLATRIFWNISVGAVSFLAAWTYAEERLAVFNRLSVFGEDAQHLAADIGFNLVHEFHGFDNAQGLTRLHVPANLDKRLRSGTGRRVIRAHNRRLHQVQVLCRTGFRGRQRNSRCQGSLRLRRSRDNDLRSRHLPGEDCVCRGFLQADLQVAPRILKLLEVMLGHEIQQVFNMLNFRAGELGIGARLGGLFGFHACSNLYKVPRNAGEHFCSVSMHRDVVFNTNSSNARHVNAWFDGNHVPWNQDVLLSPRHPRIFVHFQPEPVSSAVHEVIVKPVSRQNPSGSGIDIPATDADPRGRDGGRLRFLDRAIPLPYARRGASYEDSPREIAAIVGEYSTQVQYHQFIFPQSLFRGPRMRVR